MAFGNRDKQGTQESSWGTTYVFLIILKPSEVHFGSHHCHQIYYKQNKTQLNEFEDPIGFVQ